VDFVAGVVLCTAAEPQHLRGRLVQARHADHKRFAHPQLGVLELDCDALAIPGSDQVLVVYSAIPGSSDAETLALLRVLGVQPQFRSLEQRV
jgi:hypothetical protein